MPSDRNSRIAGGAVVLFAIAVQIEDAWDMHIRQITYGAGDYLFSALVVASTLLAAFILPGVLRWLILFSYLAVLVYHVILFGPVGYFRQLPGPHGTASDIFFGSLIFAGQSILLLGHGTGRLARIGIGRLRST